MIKLKTILPASAAAALAVGLLVAVPQAVQAQGYSYDNGYSGYRGYSGGMYNSNRDPDLPYDSVPYGHVGNGAGYSNEHGRYWSGYGGGIGGYGGPGYGAEGYGAPGWGGPAR
jgi:hypothetical protein